MSTIRNSLRTHEKLHSRTRQSSATSGPLVLRAEPRYAEAPGDIVAAKSKNGVRARVLEKDCATTRCEHPREFRGRQTEIDVMRDPTSDDSATRGRATFQHAADRSMPVTAAPRGQQRQRQVALPAPKVQHSRAGPHTGRRRHGFVVMERLGGGQPCRIQLPRDIIVEVLLAIPTGLGGTQRRFDSVPTDSSGIQIGGL